MQNRRSYHGGNSRRQLAWDRICTGPFRSSALHLVCNLLPLSPEAEAREGAASFQSLLVAMWAWTRPAHTKLSPSPVSTGSYRSVCSLLIPIRSHHIGSAEMLQSGGQRIFMDRRVEQFPNRYLTMAPKRDLEAEGRQQLTLGDTTITIWRTPGHTAATLSCTFTVFRPRPTGQCCLLGRHWVPLPVGSRCRGRGSRASVHRHWSPLPPNTCTGIRASRPSWRSSRHARRQSRRHADRLVDDSSRDVGVGHRHSHRERSDRDDDRHQERIALENRSYRGKETDAVENNGHQHRQPSAQAPGVFNRQANWANN
jgi:hypothetical protein